MSHLERALHAHFAQLQNTQGATTNGATVPSAMPAPTPVTNASASETSAFTTPFARVNTVESTSPADQAGLKAGDLVRGFGNVHWLNHERLSKVAETVQQNEGVCISHDFPAGG